MKKISIIIASVVFFSSISAASVYQTAQQPSTTSKTTKKTAKKTDKKEVKKVPHRTTTAKKPANTTKATK